MEEPLRAAKRTDCFAQPAQLQTTMVSGRVPGRGVEAVDKLPAEATATSLA